MRYSLAYTLCILKKLTDTSMKGHHLSITDKLVKVSSYSEGLTSLVAGSYVLSLAIANRNLALRIALGVTGGYLILRSGSKLRAGIQTEQEILNVSR